MAQILGDAGRQQSALKPIEKAVAGARDSGDFALLSDSLAYDAALTAMLGRISQARERIEEALAVAIENDLPEQITNAYRRQANVNEYASNYEAYRDIELAALDRCRSLGQDTGKMACLSCVSYAYFRLGQYDEAREAVEDLEVDGELRSLAFAVKACIHTLRGVSQGIEPLIAEARRLTSSSRSNAFRILRHLG